MIAVSNNVKQNFHHQQCLRGCSVQHDKELYICSQSKYWQNLYIAISVELFQCQIIISLFQTLQDSTVTVFYLLIDSLLQEQLRLFFTLSCSVLLQVCYVFHDMNYFLKIDLCGVLWWCFCSSVYLSMTPLTQMLYIKYCMIVKVLQLVLKRLLHQ